MNSPNVPCLRDLGLQATYNRDTCPDLLHGFYVPVLRSAVTYDRTTFTFNGTSLRVAAAGIAGLIINGGKMRLICNHTLEREVVNAILRGEKAAEEAVVESLHNSSLTDIDAADLQEKSHLDLLTWLVKEGHLAIKVAIPKNPYGAFHRKHAVLSDAHGCRISFDGSVNESFYAWQFNDEVISVLTDWETPAHVDQHAEAFEKLWRNEAESSIVIPIPEALKRQLIDYAPTEERVRGIAERQGGYQGPNGETDPLRKELWAAIHHAIKTDPQTTLETIAAELWPHQLSFWKRYARDAENLPRVLIADEVGLGKTIEAGALLKTFINRGKADRVLILTPASSRWQWQAELRHKFNIKRAGVGAPRSGNAAVPGRA